MAVFIVDTTADLVDAGDHKLSLREAVALANNTGAADTIRFAPELETATLTLAGGELVLRQDVTIDGDGIGVTLSGADAHRIVRTSGGATDVTLKCLTLTHGYAIGNGGAVYAGGGRLVLNDCTITDSVAYHGSGGGILASGRVSITNSIISNNEAVGYDGGGGISVFGNVEISNSTLSGNVGYDGGAIGGSGEIRATQTAIIDNHAGDSGGGITLFDGNIVLAKCIVSGNSVSGSDDPRGGGITAYGGVIRLNGTTISDNSGGYWGGGIEAYGASISIENSTIVDNRADLAGAGISANGGEIIMKSSTVTANILSAVRFFDEYGQLFPSGGGIRINGSVASLYDNIVSGNLMTILDPSTQVYDSDVSGSIARSNSHNIFGSVVSGAIEGDLQDVDPLLLFAAIDPDTGGGVVADHGGPTPTVALWDDRYNPALGRADPRLAGTEDQRGVERPRPAGSDPDIGAFELAQSFGEPMGRRFDALEYIASHRDLIQALGPSETAGTSHYRFFGSEEGRGITFDGLEYIASYADLIAAFGTEREAGARHFIEFGLDEGRPADDFDAEQYLPNYADLQAAFGGDTEAATVHFIRCGHGEGRSDAALDLLL